MEIKDLYTFTELSKACGNQYLAVKFIAESARKLGSTNKQYHISESKLIEWVLTGRCPYTEWELQRRLHSFSDKALEDTLCWVSDKQICSMVRRYYKKSLRLHHLNICEDATIPQSKIDRVNVLLRMIWYSAE